METEIQIATGATATNDLGVKNLEYVGDDFPIDSSLFEEPSHIRNLQIRQSENFHVGNKIILQRVDVLHITRNFGDNTVVTSERLNEIKDGEKILSSELNPENEVSKSKEILVETALNDPSSNRSDNLGLEQKHKKWKICISISILATLAISAVILVPYFIIDNYSNDNDGDTKDSDFRNSNDSDINYPNASDDNFNVLKIIPRRGWIARPPTGRLVSLKHPAPQVIIHHTASDPCFTRPVCMYTVRQIQTYHVEARNWSDIGYHFLVGGEGGVYEGRGWDFMGAGVKGFNRLSVFIAMIGTFNLEKPTEKQIAATKLIIAEGVKLKKISRDYRLIPHCNATDTQSPGLEGYNELKTWPHFSEIAYTG